MKIDRTIYTREWLYEQYWTNRLSLSQIAKIIGCSMGGVYKLMKIYNIQRRLNLETLTKYDKSLYTKEWIEQKYINEKLSINQISEQYKINASVIFDWLKIYNIQRRNKSEAVKLHLPKLNIKTGVAHHNFNKPVSMEARNKMSQSGIQFDREIYTKDWLYEQYHVNLLSTNKISKIINCSRDTVRALMKEYNIPVRTLSESGLLWDRSNIVYKRGPENKKWTGLRPLHRQIRCCKEYYDWRIKIFIKDKNKCSNCESKLKHEFQIDHIKPFAIILFENNIQTLGQALECKELWDVNNGRILCKKCHKQTDTYGVGTIKLLKEIRSIS